VLAAAALGWALNGWFFSRSLGVKEEISGTVSLVNATGAKVCVHPANGGPERCSVVYQRPDAAPLVVGQQVRIAIAELRVGSAETDEIFVLESRSP
jgi:hypothetical protein